MSATFSDSFSEKESRGIGRSDPYSPRTWVPSSLPPEQKARAMSLGGCSDNPAKHSLVMEGKQTQAGSLEKLRRKRKVDRLPTPSRCTRRVTAHFRRKPASTLLAAIAYAPLGVVRERGRGEGPVAKVACKLKVVRAAALGPHSLTPDPSPGVPGEGRPGAVASGASEAWGVRPACQVALR